MEQFLTSCRHFYVQTLFYSPFYLIYLFYAEWRKMSNNNKNLYLLSRILNDIITVENFFIREEQMKERGITLIALTVTIVVLIILTSISIRIILSNGRSNWKNK